MPEETFWRLLERAEVFLFRVFRVLIAVILFFTTIAIINSSLIKRKSLGTGILAPPKSTSFGWGIRHRSSMEICLLQLCIVPLQIWSYYNKEVKKINYIFTLWHDFSFPCLHRPHSGSLWLSASLPMPTCTFAYLLFCPRISLLPHLCHFISPSSPSAACFSPSP